MKWDRKRKASGCFKSKIIIVCLLSRTEHDWWKEKCVCVYGSHECHDFQFSHWLKKHARTLTHAIFSLAWNGFSSNGMRISRTKSYYQIIIILERLHIVYVIFSIHGGSCECTEIAWVCDIMWCDVMWLCWTPFFCHFSMHTASLYLLFHVVIFLETSSKYKSNILFESHSSTSVVKLWIANGFPVVLFFLFQLVGDCQLRVSVHARSFKFFDKII